MDRVIVYIGEIPRDTDILQSQKNAYIGIAKLASTVLGTSTLLNGLPCTQHSPNNLTVDVGAGEIYSLQNIDNTAYGDSIDADTTHQIYKQGVRLDSINLSCPAPVTVGNSINYVIQIGFSETDTGSIILPYFNSAAPTVPFTGPANSGQPSYTNRQNGVNVSVKTGVSAPTGTQVTPTPDAGFTGAYVVTVAQGQTAITNSNISLYPNAPFITETLTQKASIATIQSGSANFAIDTGSVNAYAASLTPAISSYSQGLPCNILISHTNTSTSCTLNLNSLGTKSIKLTNGSNIKIGDLLINMIAQFQYDGTNFQLLNPATLLSNSSFVSNDIETYTYFGGV
jgi:hypothetical protein